MRVLLIACAAALAACAPKAAEEAVAPAPTPAPQSPPSQSQSLPAPTPAGVTQRITAEDKGKTITVPVGATFAVQLVGVPTAGYLWGVAEKPAFLSDARESGGNTTTAQSRPGFTGGNHWEVFAFQARSAGEGVLKLEQRRPWEPKSEPATDTFTVTIKAQ
jgi:inhibitor of cysteine peptidase